MISMKLTDVKLKLPRVIQLEEPEEIITAQLEYLSQTIDAKTVDIDLDTAHAPHQIQTMGFHVPLEVDHCL